MGPPALESLLNRTLSSRFGGGYSIQYPCWTCQTRVCPSFPPLPPPLYRPSINITPALWHTALSHTHTHNSVTQSCHTHTHTHTTRSHSTLSHTHPTLSYTTFSHKHNSVTHNFATRAWHFWHWAGSGGPGLVRIDAAMLEVHVTSPARQLEREATGFHGGLIGSMFWLHTTLSRNVVAHTAFSHTQHCSTHVIHKSAIQHNPIVMQPITMTWTCSRGWLDHQPIFWYGDSDHCQTSFLTLLSDTDTRRPLLCPVLSVLSVLLCTGASIIQHQQR